MESFYVNQRYEVRLTNVDDLFANFTDVRDTLSRTGREMKKEGERG